MTDKIEQARYLYMQGNVTQRSIAEQLGVTERTVYNWIRTNAWDRLRRAASAAPAMIVENLCSQLVEMQDAIAARSIGSRFPTLQEAEITRKIITCIEKMKKYPSLGLHQQVLESFRRFTAPKLTGDLERQLGWRSERYLEAEAKQGYFPYQVEYGTNCEPVPPPVKEEETPGTRDGEETAREHKESAGAGENKGDNNQPIHTDMPAAGKTGNIFTPENNLKKSIQLTENKLLTPLSGHHPDRKEPENSPGSEDMPKGPEPPGQNNTK